MQTQLNKSKKIIIETTQEHKANKTGFAIFSLSRKKFYIKPYSGQEARNRNKTLTNSKESSEQAAPLETTPHKESNKIWFGIFPAVHKQLSNKLTFAR